MVDDDGTKNEQIGVLETTLAAIMGSKAQNLQADLHQEQTSKSQGKIFVRADAVKDSNLEYQFSFVWNDAGNI